MPSTTEHSLWGKGRCVPSTRKTDRPRRIEFVDEDAVSREAPVHDPVLSQCRHPAADLLADGQHHRFRGSGDQGAACTAPRAKHGELVEGRLREACEDEVADGCFVVCRKRAEADEVLVSPEALHRGQVHRTAHAGLQSAEQHSVALQQAPRPLPSSLEHLRVLP
eukprot:441767-Rhodomonas_salina.1